MKRLGGALFSRRPKMHKSPDGKLARILSDFSVDTVLDVGANIGQTRDKLRNAGYRGRIISFEPVPSAHAELTRKAKSDSAWEIAPRTAIGAAPGEVDINVSEATDMSSILDASPALLETLPKTKITEVVKTPVTTLDVEWSIYCPTGSNVFLKVDTQGYERQVLNGAAESLKRLVGVQLELSLLPLYDGEETYLSYLRDLHDWGFEPYMMWENYFSRLHGRQMQMDVVFMRGDL
ncbi:MAG: FkbM family methyltransferase [Alphaproteobacteria bacterium]|nr:FkbM family methyltransferase [Alphaproteobacteria bacterium]